MVAELLQLAQLPLGCCQNRLERCKSKSYPPLLRSSLIIQKPHRAKQNGFSPLDVINSQTIPHPKYLCLNKTAEIKLGVSCGSINFSPLGCISIVPLLGISSPVISRLQSAVSYFPEHACWLNVLTLTPAAHNATLP